MFHHPEFAVLLYVFGPIHIYYNYYFLVFMRVFSRLLECDVMTEFFLWSMLCTSYRMGFCSCAIRVPDLNVFTFYCRIDGHITATACCV
jgi:hypothetical protein